MAMVFVFWLFNDGSRQLHSFFFTIFEAVAEMVNHPAYTAATGL
jgi:hypothetical protein